MSLIIGAIDKLLPARKIEMNKQVVLPEGVFYAKNIDV